MTNISYCNDCSTAIEYPDHGQPPLWCDKCAARQGFVAVNARTTDPETSHMAAAQVEADQLGLKRQVGTVVAILEGQGGPISDFELARLWSLYWVGTYSESMPRKARHFAREAGLVSHQGYGEHQGRKVRLYGLGNEAMTAPVPCPCCGRNTRAKTVIQKIEAWLMVEPDQPGLGL